MLRVMIARLLPAALSAALSGCYEDVPGYCDATRPCAADGDVCVLPDRQCVQAQAWAELSGMQAVPPLPSVATGTLKIARSSDGRLAFNLRYSVPRGTVRAVHLHKGKPGSPPGTVTVSLPGAQPPAAGQTVMGALDIASDDQVMGILSGEYYLDVHTDNLADAMAGDVEARGQIWPLPAYTPLTYAAMLSAKQESQPSTSPALGTVQVKLDEEGGLDWSANLSGTRGSVTLVHIHRGPFGGEIGPHIVDFRPGDVMNGTGRKTRGDIYPQQAVAYPILLRAGLAYWNVHTTDQADGEVRGQLLAPGTSGQRPQPFAVALQPMAPAPSTFAAVAYFVLSDDGLWLSYRLDHNAVPNVTQVKVVNGAMSLTLPTGRLLGLLPVMDGTALSRADLLAGKVSLQIATAEYQPAMTGKLLIPQP